MGKKFFLPKTMIDRPVVVHIVGAGGTGGEMLENMVRLHFLLKELGHPGFEISIHDHDVVSESNIGRTRFMPTDVGHNKAEVLADRYSLAYGLDIAGYGARFSVAEHFGGYVGGKGRLCISCTDSAQFRIEFASFFDRIGSDVLWLDLGNDRLHGQAVLGTPVSKGEKLGGVRLPHAVDLFGNDFSQAARKGEDADSCSLVEAVEMQSLFVNKAMAIHASHMLFELFKNGVIDYHGLLVDLRDGSVRRIQINPSVWSFFGHTPQAA